MHYRTLNAYTGVVPISLRVTLFAVIYFVVCKSSVSSYPKSSACLPCKIVCIKTSPDILLWQICFGLMYSMLRWLGREITMIDPIITSVISLELRSTGKNHRLTGINYR
jgi:hypothetical protein